MQRIKEVGIAEGKLNLIVNGKPVREINIFNAHLDSPINDRKFEGRGNKIAALVSRMNDLNAAGKTVLATGDFNFDFIDVPNYWELGKKIIMDFDEDENLKILPFERKKIKDVAFNIGAVWNSAVGFPGERKPFYYLNIENSGQRNDLWTVDWSALPIENLRVVPEINPRLIIDYIVSNKLTGECNVLNGRNSESSRIDQGKGCDHYAIKCALNLGAVDELFPQSGESAGTNWVQIFGGEAGGGESLDEARHVSPTPDGGYIAGGILGGGSGEGGIWGGKYFVMKFSPYGAREWETTFKASDGINDFHFVEQLKDGSYEACGSDDNNIYIWKLDESGNEIKSKKYQGSADAVIRVSDGGYLVADRIWSNSGAEIVIRKISPDGKQAWKKNFTGKNDDWVESMIQTKDGGFAITGAANAVPLEGTEGWSSCKIFVMKLNSKGEKAWYKTFGAGNICDRGESIIEAGDGGFAIAAGRYVLRLDSKGGKVWTRELKDLWAAHVNALDGGGFVITGSAYNPDALFIQKIDAKGSQVWINTYKDLFADCVKKTADGGFILAGFAQSYSEGDPSIVESGFVLKLDSNGRGPLMSLSTTQAKVPVTQTGNEEKTTEIVAGISTARVNIKTGELNVRKSPSAKDKTVAYYMPKDDCVLIIEKGKKNEGRNWSRVYHPYFGVTGWVDESFLAPTGSDCSFELFLYNNAQKPYWIKDFLAEKMVFNWETLDIEKGTETYSRKQIIDEINKKEESAAYYNFQEFSTPGFIGLVKVVAIKPQEDMIVITSANGDEFGFSYSVAKEKDKVTLKIGNVFMNDGEIFAFSDTSYKFIEIGNKYIFIGTDRIGSE